MRHWAGAAAGAATGALWTALLAVLADLTPVGTALTATGLTILLVAGGALYDRLLLLGRLRGGPVSMAVLYWSIAFVPAGLLHAAVVNPPPLRSLRDVILTLALEAAIGAGYGVGFWLLHFQLAGLAARLSRRKGKAG